MNIELPVATNVRVNTDSLYQQCLKLIEKIYPLEGFDTILFSDGDYSKISDPVKIIWDMCRLGSPLCLLYNLLQPTTPLEAKQGDNISKANVSKRCVFLFIQACRSDLHIPEDELFKITDVFKEDTNLFIKVVNVLNILLKTIEERGYYPKNIKPLPFNIPNSEDIESPKDNRAKLVAELLNTERSYVQDLERLHNYQIEAEAKILSKEDSITLFSNLGQLLDFQRKFLIHMESALSVSTQEQRIGHLFSSMEKGFEVYQIFCANQDKAAKFALENCDSLVPLTNIMEPKYELPSYLIKPVQRICKYPLLLNELMKYDTKAEHPYCHELQLGLNSIKRVTELTNEIKRQEENEEITEDLKNNIQDWKGVKVDELGLLLLRGNFTISNGNNEREYVLFLFQNMLLCCQEKKQEKKKKGKTKITYILKGSIYISSIERVLNKSVISENFFALKIYWSDKLINQSFTIKSVSEEQCNRWLTQIEKLVDIDKQKTQTLSRRHQDYNNRYVTRVNHIDGMFMDEEYDNINKGVHNTHSMYNKPVSRSGYNNLSSASFTSSQNNRALNRSKSQPNIFNINGHEQHRYGFHNQEAPPLPSYSNNEYNYNTNIPLQNSNTLPDRKNTMGNGREQSNFDNFSAPQRTVSSHVKHNHSMNNLRHYPKYNEPDDYYTSKSPTNGSNIQSSFIPQTAPLPPTPTITTNKSLYSSKSNNNLSEEYKSNNNNNNNNNKIANSPTTNFYPERKASHAKPLKINIEDYSNRRYNNSSKLSESYSEREDVGSLSPASTTSNSLSVSYDPYEPMSPTGSFYHRNQYNQKTSKKGESYNNNENNSLRNDYNEFDINNNYNYSKSNSRNEVEDPVIYNNRRSEYNNDSYDYERSRNRERSRSRTREKSIRERDDEHNRARSKSRTRNPNYRNPSSTVNSVSQLIQDSSNYDKDRPNEKILRNQSSVSSLSYEIKKNASIKSNASSNSMGRKTSGGSSNPVNSFNNNFTNSPRMRPSPPSTPRPSTPNLNRPSTPNLNRPSTPNISSRLNNIRRPSTPLNSSLSSNTYSSSDTTTVRSNYTKIKVSYNSQEFIIVAPSSGCTYNELISKIERKIRLNERTISDNRPLRIRYKDEDNDFVTIITDEDINLAFEIALKIWKSNKDTNEPMLSMMVNLYVDRK
ncbi:hypothetical protein BCR36DRAFT_415463 [Piromyces finnis]|uniref:RhoGEF-domain-containing protein n=1 Tax=Piromyces finnis TaxID=1754191 RepID=A0A1Y1UZZ9_9FUNG|nr:hypothetical protein BCR36DRAFT_415463 [Piromyces finnis]|eukprot:ORX43613.1 hypothetical protein BCR36DRAFT_415463 [Piromyces finnis]